MGSCSIAFLYCQCLILLRKKNIISVHKTFKILFYIHYSWDKQIFNCKAKIQSFYFKLASLVCLFPINVKATESFNCEKSIKRLKDKGIKSRVPLWIGHCHKNPWFYLIFPRGIEVSLEEQIRYIHHPCLLEKLIDQSINQSINHSLNQIHTNQKIKNLN